MFEKERECFPRQVRLVQQRDFDRVFQSRIATSDATLIVHGVRNGTAQSRLGISVSRRVGNAVHRNRWKRLIREAFRRQQAELPHGLDLVVRPQRGSNPDHDAIFSSLIALSKKLDRRLPRATMSRGSQ
jgi:ribonuclease P protein component